MQYQTIIRTCLVTIAASGMLLSRGSANAASDVAAPFQAYYDQHQGMRVLGHAQSSLEQVGGFPAQYFEKGRIEDHSTAEANPAWRFMYGRITAELMDAAPDRSVNGTFMNYADFKRAADPQQRHPFSAKDVLNLTMGQTPEQSGIMVPYDPQLRPAPGYIVPHYFWTYINDASLFPGGWLHDIGLPMTDAIRTQVVKNGVLRDIITQAFERTVLTYDPQNPAGWQVERGNIGTDALLALEPPTPNQSMVNSAVGQVRMFLHAVATDPVAAETGWVDILSQTAKSRYVGTGHVKGSGWIPRLLGIQNTPPDCLNDNPHCTVQPETITSGGPGTVLVTWVWGNGSRTDLHVHMVMEHGAWKIDDVTR